VDEVYCACLEFLKNNHDHACKHSLSPTSMSMTKAFGQLIMIERKVHCRQRASKDDFLVLKSQDEIGKVIQSLGYQKLSGERNDACEAAGVDFRAFVLETFGGCVKETQIYTTSRCRFDSFTLRETPQGEAKQSPRLLVNNGGAPLPCVTKSIPLIPVEGS
jgi:hypothetical protein